MKHNTTGSSAWANLVSPYLFWQMMTSKTTTFLTASLDSYSTVAEGWYSRLLVCRISVWPVDLLTSLLRWSISRWTLDCLKEYVLAVFHILFVGLSWPYLSNLYSDSLDISDHSSNISRSQTLLREDHLQRLRRCSPVALIDLKIGTWHRHIGPSSPARSCFYCSSFCLLSVQ